MSISQTPERSEFEYLKRIHFSNSNLPDAKLGSEVIIFKSGELISIEPTRRPGPPGGGQNAAGSDPSDDHT
jgi:hypothetical protein